MAALLFLDFDASLGSAQGSNPANWADWAKPPGVYNMLGVVTQDQTVSSSINFITGRGSASAAFGNGVAKAIGQAPYTDGSQIAINRAAWGIGTEFWFSSDIQYFITSNSTTANTSAINAVFRFGDLNINVKSVTLVVSTYTVVFSVNNNGTEVATITVPNVNSLTWSYLKVACKLHASTGYITATIDGVSMSASYTGQNTVQSIAANSTGSTTSADHIYAGCPVSIRSSNVDVGARDNVYIDDTAHLSGRPRGDRVSLGSSSTDVSAAAVGTSATTVVDALNNPTDAKAVRFTGAAASTIMSLASISTTGLQSDVIGVNIYLKRPANRDANVVRHLSAGVDISGAQTMGTLAAAATLPISSVSTPPNTDYPVQGLFDYVYSAGITTSNLANVKIRLLTS